MIANIPGTEIFAATELVAATSSQILVGLGSLYLGLVVCWAIYWMFFGMSEKKRHASMTKLTHQVNTHQKQIANIEREFSLTIDAFAISHAKAQTLELEVSMLQERIEQLESAQFELEQQAAEWTAKAETQTQAAASPTEAAASPTEIAAAGPVATTEQTIEKVLPSITLFTPVRGANQKIDASLGLVYTEEPKNADDLTEIWGIGAVNQQRLNEHGVYLFDQISKWTPQQMDAFNVILGFKGRIEREQWVDQAKKRVDQNSESRKAA